MADSIEQLIEQALVQIRPRLENDGGDVELVRFDHETGVAHIRLKGACVGCPMADVTLKMCVEAELKRVIPQLKEVALM